MNKKIFTLLAISLMLFTTAFTVDAQVWWSNLSRWYGNPVKNVPVVKKGEKGEKVGAYQLVVTSKGPHAVTGTQDSILLRNGRPFYALAMDEDGYLVLVDSTYLYPPLIGLGAVTDPRERYARLRESLWCAKVQEDEQEDLGLRPGFRFINREYATPLAVSNKGPWINHPGNEIGPYQTQQNECNVDDEAILVGGNLESWDFNSWTYSGSVEDSAYLRIQVGNATDDRFLTLISDGTFRNGRPAIKLAKVSGKAFIPTDPITGNVNAFYRDTLVRFTLSSAAPRVLTKEDINTRLWTRTLDEAENNPGINLQFDPAPTLGENVFAKTVVAEDPTGEVKNGNASIPTGTAVERTRLNYVRLKVLNDASGSDKYITVLDGSNAENYYNNSNNHLFPKIVAGSYTQGTSDFRFIYYPSEDSVAVNLFSITSKEKGFAADNGKYGPVPGPSQTTDLYNWEIWNNLILRLQDLDTRDQTVLTVRDIPNGLRMHFGVAGCEIDDHRATVETDLYIIRDSTGRVLCVPLWAGDMTPRWVAMEANEDPHYMPSCHWLVMKVNEQNPVSRVHFVNREFDRVILEYIQVYDTLARFNANWRICYQLNEYYPAVDTDEAWISTGERFFEKVIDTEKEKFRTDPYLGYKHLSAADLLAIRGYSFRYLHNFTSEPGAKQLYLGVGETNKTKTDTALYVLNDRTFFELSMEPNLLSLPDSTEKYGIGWVDNDDFVQLLSFVQFDLSTHQNTKDIARLERSYYRLRINDYFKYRWNDNYLVLEENGSNARYVYTPEEWAIPRRLGPSKFYLRSTYQTTNGEKPVEYYALLDRIDDRDFDYLTQITGLTLTNVNAWGIDRSHAIVNISLNPAAAQEWGLGVLKMAVDENSGRVRAEVKATTPRVSTFEIQSIDEPIYRRFDSEDEGSVATDDPDTVRFYRPRTDNGTYKNYLYEDQHSGYSYDYGGAGTSAYGNGIRFLGDINSKEDQSKVGRDQVYPHNFAIYVDTAYVNRGTGPIKPQYMLVTNPKKDFGYADCPTCGDGSEIVHYVYGRYLRNQADSAWRGGFDNGVVLKKEYIWHTNWNRLSFVNAIHARDTLYILNEQTTVDTESGKIFDPIVQYYSNYKAGANGGLNNIEGAEDDPGNRLNFAKLYSDGIAKGKVVARALDNNFHKDEVFSFRYVNRQINSDGSKIKNPNKEFFIESETTDRPVNGRGGAPVIAPMRGGWIKVQDYVPVISRGSYEDAILQADIFDVEKAVPDEPVANESVAATDVKVISGKGSVTILHAAGKNVLISNLLGQTVASTVLTSDYATLDAPQGIVVVTIDGNAVKAVVK